MTIAIQAPTVDQVLAFAKNLGESMKEAILRGEDVFISQEHDTERCPADDSYGTVIDHRYMGVTMTVKIGRPATLAKVEEERRKTALLSKLATSNTA